MGLWNTICWRALKQLDWELALVNVWPWVNTKWQIRKVSTSLAQILHLTFVAVGSDRNIHLLQFLLLNPCKRFQRCWILFQLILGQRSTIHHRVEKERQTSTQTHIHTYGHFRVTNERHQAHVFGWWGEAQVPRGNEQEHFAQKQKFSDHYPSSSLCWWKIKWSKMTSCGSRKESHDLAYSILNVWLVCSVSLTTVQ